MYSEISVSQKKWLLSLFPEDMKQDLRLRNRCDHIIQSADETRQFIYTHIDIVSAYRAITKAAN